MCNNVWNLNSIYKSFNSDSFQKDITIIRKYLSSLERNTSLLNDNEEYRYFYKVFNKAMTYSNLKSISKSDIFEASKYLNELRAIYNKISKLRTNKNDVKNILKPSSDIFRSLYYSNRNNPYIVQECLVGIKKNTEIIADINGYNSVLDMALEIYQIPKIAFEKLVNSIEKLIPYFKTYYENENYYKIYNSNIKTKEISLNRAKNIISNALNVFSKDALTLFENSFNDNWFDLNPKSSDPLCINIPSISQFRIKLKFDNNLKSLLSLSHEFGHGFHGSTLYDTDILKFSYPLSIAETCALFFEDLIYKYTPDEYKSKDIYNANMALFTIDVYSRFLFEQRVFKNMYTSYLNASTLDKYMKESLVYCYGDIHGLNERLWLDKSHFYNLSRPFYNISYIFGLFVAKILFFEYEKDRDQFSIKYKDFFSNTNILSIENNLKSVFNINILDNKYWHIFEDEIIKRLNRS